MNRKILSPSGGVIYNNIAMISPNGEVMCYISSRKAEWYLVRGLADFTDETKKNIQLKFIPKGLGNHNDPFHMTPKPNVCVVCGTQENLTRHHCVPRCFSRHFPLNHKINSSHDLLVLCEDCHCLYEQHAAALKNKILHPTEQQEKERIHIRMLKQASAIMNPNTPEERKNYLRSRVAAYHGRETMTDEEIKELTIESRSNFHFNKWKKIVVELSDINVFVQMWRKHFVETMQPKFLPKHWSIDYHPKH